MSRRHRGFTVGYDNSSLESGLFGTEYSGYWNSDVSWFKSRTPGDEVTDYDNDTDVSIGTYSVTQSTMWCGFFLPDSTGSWRFEIRSDDVAYLWVGDDAIAGYTTSNHTVTIDVGTASGSETLTSGVLAPIRVMHGNNGVNGDFSLRFEGPGAVPAETGDGSGYYFSSRYIYDQMVNDVDVFNFVRGMYGIADIQRALL